MAAKYVSIFLQDMQEVLKAEKGWRYYAPPSSEIYFRYDFKQHEGLYILVYTSIVPQGMESRECGKDAIRTALQLHIPGNKDETIIKTFTRVHRTQNWRTNLIARIKEAYVYTKNPAIICPRCGNILSLKRNKSNNELFQGCVGYNYIPRRCSFTRRPPLTVL